LGIRKARIADLREVHKLINEFARREVMIPRSMNELYENMRDIVLYEEEGSINGVCALHILWEDLAEIKSLAVKQEYQHRGIGRKLVKRCLAEGRGLGVRRVFVLTYQPDFFRKLGFAPIDKSELPQKIWGDCVRCPKFPECDEHAMIITF
jgi:amino-acid N-acetyltransferase